MERGVRIALTERIPEPVRADPTGKVCRACSAWRFCHGARCIGPGCVHCRTCAHVTPVRDGSWQCENIPLYGMDPGEQLEGCPRHVLHPDLVPWPLLGSDSDGNGLYQIGGKTVVNGRGGVLSADLLNGRREPRSDVSQ